jgi:two-component system OmpR family sensor kinase
MAIVDSNGVLDGEREPPSVDAPAAPAAPLRRFGRPEPGIDPARRASTPRRSWSGAVASTRLRMLVAYLLLLVLAAGITIVGIRETLLIRLSDRVEQDLGQEVLEVERFFEIGRDPETGQPFDSLSRAFDVYLDRNVPSVEEAFIAFIGGEVYRDRLRSYPVATLPPSAVAEWANFSTGPLGVADDMSGEFDTEAGSARYLAVRVAVGTESGAFVVTILPAAERHGVRELQTVGLAVMLGAVLIAAACAWFIAGRVLKPVQELTETARSISASDRTGRIRVSGTGEAAEMARTFNDMLDRLESVYQSQLDFVRAAGHELRTPLTVATGHLDLPLEGDDQRAAKVLVLDELARMGRIVDDLQCLAETVRPDFVVPEGIALEQLVHDVITKASALGDRDWQLDGAPAITFVGDRHRLTEALLNLADNAVKNTSPDGAVGIGAAARNGDVHIWVRDTGVGISADERDRVFESFTRGRGASRRYRGAGLGLAIVKAIADAHGGSVQLESQPGMGSLITLVIPRGDAPWPES